MTKSRRLAYLALIFNAIIWGAAFPIVKPAFAFITPLQYLYLRFLAAGLFAIPIFLYFSLKLRPKVSYLIKCLALETLQMLALPVLYLGLDKTSALDASLIGATGPAFVILGGILFLRERQEKREWQGLALSLAGSLLIVFEPLITGAYNGGSGSLTGNLYIIAYNILYMAYALLAKKVYKKKPPFYLGSLTYLLAALIFAGLTVNNVGLPAWDQLLHPSVLFPVLYMAIPGGILAFILYLYAQSKIEVSEANLFYYLNGVVAIPTAYFLLGEVPTLPTILAILLIAFGVYRAEFRQKR